MAIKTVVFDLGNVLLSFDHMRSCRAISSLSGFPAQKIYDEVFGSELEMQYDLGEISSAEFARRVKDAFGLAVDDREVQRIWADVFRPVSGMEELVLSLKGGYKLALLSNTNEWHFEHCLRTFPVLQQFEEFLLSYRLGSRKPDPAIFKEALRRTATAPEHCLYIDDIPDYILSAESLGINALCFEGIDKLRSEMNKIGVRV